MEYVVYLLYSKKYNRLYTGFTTDLIVRFHSHNKFGTKGWTIRYRPWEVIYVKFFDEKREAMNHEKFLKSGC